ncbi:hypothetical protein [Desulfosporosinus sp. OT]|uniref:hypothetical protein n=1 Tax=Desulfosporosinus sp. OT TaxID=913865 RepID=UPI000223A2E6|nr:hypothetical protein [Desulfosporosinus sp. OT]EGW38523.1 hypothetical protein DOT_3586 [Desulfosporosinus sp. OT]
MLLKRFGSQTLIIAVALVAGITAGSLGFGHALANPYSDKKAPVYPKNANGQTYGSGLDAISIDTMPDLISAVGADGTSGYVRPVDLIPPLAKTRDEALAQQSNRKVGEIRKIPLYAKDGKTVIGVFNAVNTQPIEKSAGSK